MHLSIPVIPQQRDLVLLVPYLLLQQLDLLEELLSHLLRLHLILLHLRAQVNPLLLMKSQQLIDISL
mgnify:CR=1 FL=1